MMPEPQSTGAFSRVTLQVNYACNQRCLHCYQDAGPHLFPRDRSAERNLLAIIRRLRELGFAQLKLMGGEALLHPGLVALLTEAKALGFRSALITGGSAGSRAVWSRLADLLDECWFSLYHPEPDVHDHLVQCHGALAALWKNFERISGSTRRGFHLLLNRPLLEKLDLSLEVLCGHGADAIKILWPSPDGAALRNWEEYAVAPEEWPSISRAALAARHRYPQVRIALARHAIRSKRAQEAIASNPQLGCNYGDRKLWGVDPEGRLYPCCLLMDRPDYALGHVLELSAAEIEERVRELALRDSRRRLGPLAGCGHCPALLDAAGRDRRARGEWEPICPLVQVPMERTIAEGADT